MDTRRLAARTDEASDNANGATAAAAAAAAAAADDGSACLVGWLGAPLIVLVVAGRNNR